MQTGITFDNPWILALIPVLAAFVITAGKKLHFRSAAKKRMVTAIRILLMICLVLAMSSPNIKSSFGQTGTIFLADVSDSLKRSGDDMRAFVQQSLYYAAKKDITGFISFADEAAIVKMPDQNNKDFSLNTRIKTDGTNIEKALTMAQSIMPENTAKRLVLLTDGKETAGNALEKAKMLNRLGYTVDIVPFNNIINDEVQMDELNSPKQVNAGERFDITLKISSSTNTNAIIRLYQNRTLAQEKTVELYKGDNVFVFTDTAEESGIITYTAEIIADSDTVLQNNQLSAFTQVLDRPRIMVVERENSGENLVRFIEEYAKIVRVRPEEVPVTLQEIIRYDAFVLADINYEWLNGNFVTLLEQAVKHHGKGLLVTGGENSYAPGGYNGTLLETVLPVNMDISRKEENPNLGLVLVIDKSGSMSDGEYGISKLELAKEAAIRAAEVLEDNDWLGVIAFDDAVQWVIRTEPLTDKKKAVDLIGSIRPGGGTQILHPLEEAWQDLREKDTKLKHIILLTDGQAEKYGYERIIKGINEDGITLSTVAVGHGADTLLLKALAYGGNGRYYYTDEFSDIPSIFAKETFLAGQKYLQNRRFYPEPVVSMGILDGIEAVPPLDGYVATKIKSTARTIFRSDTEDPVLAVWQYGLGRTAAWTSDIQGAWTSQWSVWQDAPLFWGNLTSWLIQKNISTGYTINTGLKDGKGIITLTFENEIPQADTIEGVIVSPDGIAEDISLHIKEPGVYEGEIGKQEPGAYIVNLKAAGDDGSSISTGFVMPYSGEYRVLQDSEAFLEKLAKSGGGRIITDPAQVFTGPVQNDRGTKNITYLFVILSLVLLLVDIASRKLQISAEWLVKFYDRRLAPVAAGIADKLIRNYSVNNLFKKDTIQELSNPAQDTAVSYGKDEMSVKDSKMNETGKKPVKQQVSGKADHIDALLKRRKQWK